MIQRQIRPKTTVPCADLPELLRFADGNPVRTGAQWARRREEIRRLMCETFVGFPPEVAPRIVDAEVIEVVSESGGGERRRVRLTFDTTNRASFEVLVRVPSGTGRFPIFLTVPYGFWPDIAVDRGYLTCVYPGADGDDSSDLFAAAYPDCSWSLLFRRAWLGSRALDYLVTLPEADPAKVCMTGHSRNGKQSLIAAAFDERITSVAASSPGSPGAAPYRFTSHDTFNEAPDAFVNHWFLESLRDYTGREHELPIDSHGWYALIAPRPCLIGTAWNDGCEPTFAVERGYLAGSDVYRFLGAPESLRVKWRPGGHHRTKELDAKMVGEYFDWFDLSFGRGGTKRSDFPEEFIHRFDFAAWRSRLTPAELETPSADADRLTRVRWVLGTPPRSVRVDDYRGEQARGTREALAIPERDVAGGISGFYSAEESKLFDHDRWAPDSVVRVPVVFGEGVRGNVYCRRDARGPLPAVVWLHPASYATGYNEAYGPASWLSSPSTTQPRGVEITTIYHRLAAAGHLVLAFDQCGFGSRLIEGRDFYDEYPKWSRLGRMVHDVGRALDFLESGDWNSASPLPPVDRRRISAVGYALGGMVALFAAALDRRISAAASVAGFTPLRSDTDAKSTGGIRRFWEWHAFAPLLGLYAGRESELPFDFEDLFALIAPRPALVVAPRRDRFADHAEVAACLAASKRWWDEVGAGDALDFVEPDDINRLQKAQQDLVVEWLARLG